MEIKGLAAVITGGASGLGAATAQKLASLGAKVTLLDLNTDAMQEVAKETGGLALACDVTSDTGVQEALAKAAEVHGTARIVVNCAGIGPAKRIVGRDGAHDLESFRKTIDINLVGTFNVLRLAAAAMQQEEPLNEDGARGVIVNTASVAAFDGQIGQAAYAASKGGVVALTLPAAREFGKTGIRVVTIAPGLIETPMFRGLPQAAIDSLIEVTVHPRRLGRPEEYASLVAHIAENGLMNGETIRLDGSIRMPPK